jgi:hypothetical protein
MPQRRPSVSANGGSERSPATAASTPGPHEPIETIRIDLETPETIRGFLAIREIRFRSRTLSSGTQPSAPGDDVVRAEQVVVGGLR